ncbi:hypothetical protein [Streptomyces xinghaiensis]|uniref:hypothetical protein n=1 Tax=Streptomyces xinghaiensis TaxID=1038928 RepID=UPI003439D58B
MSRLMDVYETKISPDHQLFGLVDAGVDRDFPDPDDTKWLLSMPGMVYLQVPSQVFYTALRLESWSATPPDGSIEWSGQEEVEVGLPTGELAVETIDGGLANIPLVLPSPGQYRMRWKWVFNREHAPFFSPVRGVGDIRIPSGHEGDLNESQQFCLVQIWRVGRGIRR